MKTATHKAMYSSHRLPRMRPPSSARRSAQRSTGAPFNLAKVIAREGESCRVLIAGTEWTVAIDPCVDPVLLDEAVASGAWAVVTDGAAPCVAGVLCTSRSLAIDRDGSVDVELKHFHVSAEEALLKTGGAFLQLKEQEIELYGQRIVSRARELLRLLGRMIKLN